jgi:MFS family permease
MSTQVPPALTRRLMPLQVAVGLQGMLLWVPVEKLFLTQIGCNAASVGVLAAAYAAVVPVLEVPSGILADRGSRKWVLVWSTVALMASTLLGGLSRNVLTYIVAAMILGVYFALNSGTIDSIVYDTVLEETGSSTLYETLIGRVHMVEGGALAASAVAGGAMAGWTSPRFTYFATLPLVGLAVVAFLRFDEPRLHRAADPVSLRRHVATTFGTMIGQPRVRQVILLAALTALVSTALFEFGPLWLVALHARAVLYGPYWAALVSTVGVAGYLTGRLHLDRRVPLLVLGCTGPVAAMALATSRSLAVVIAAQVVLALVVAIIGIHAGLLLHDSVPSTVRTAVSSGAGTLSWVLFLPFSLVFGRLAREQGVSRSGWILTGAAVLVGILLLLSALRRPPAAAAQPAAPPSELACQDLVGLVTDYLDEVLPPDRRAGFEGHLAECAGCTEHVRQIRLTIAALRALKSQPVEEETPCC